MSTLPACGEYLIRFHGKYSAARPKEWWTPETTQTVSDLESTLNEIEDHPDETLVFVMLIEFIDGKWTAKFVTREICELLDERERERREDERDDAADRGDWEFEQRQQAAE